MKFSKSTEHFLIYLTLIFTVWYLGKVLHIDLTQIRAWLEEYPLWISGTLFILIYVGLTTLLWVGTIDLFRTTSAFLFGPYWSTLFVYIAEICNASILFLLSRKLGREFIEQKFNLKTKEKYSPTNAGFWTAFILRINPLVPFRFMDVGFGLTKLPFEKYFWAVVLGSPLRIFWLQFIIAGVGEVVLGDPKAMVSFLQNNPQAFAICVGYLILVVVVTIAVFIMTMIEKSKLQSQLVNLEKI